MAHSPRKHSLSWWESQDARGLGSCSHQEVGRGMPVLCAHSLLFCVQLRTPVPGMVPPPLRSFYLNELHLHSLSPTCPCISTVTLEPVRLIGAITVLLEAGHLLTFGGFSVWLGSHRKLTGGLHSGCRHPWSHTLLDTCLLLLPAQSMDPSPQDLMCCHSPKHYSLPLIFCINSNQCQILL